MTLRRALRWTLLSLVAATSLPAAAQSVRTIAGRGACSTSGVEGLSRQLAEAQRCLNPSAFVRFAPHPGITLSSSRIHPYLQASARDALHRAAARRAITVNSAFRTIADQYVLYHSGGCGLAATPGRSNHQSGRAVDVGSYSSVRSTLEAQGCSWLGSSDPVHFDCPGSDKRPDSVRAFQRLWNVNHPSDRIAEDGLYGPATESRLAGSPAGGFSSGACDAEPDPPPMTSAGRLLGVVYRGDDLADRVTGATVRLVGTSMSATADGTGSWSFDVPAGEYTVEASADGHTTASRTCIVGSGDTWCSVSVNRGSAAGRATGVVFEDTGAGFADTSSRIAGASVLVLESGATVDTDAEGNWAVDLPAGTYTLVASHDGYATARRTCEVTVGEAWCSLGMTPAGAAGTLRGVVFEGADSSRRVIGATVTIIETGAMAVSREGDGSFSFDLGPGAYTVEVTGAGYEPAMRSCEVATGGETWCSVGLTHDGTGGGLLVEPFEEGDHMMEPMEDLDDALDETVPAAPRGDGLSGCSAGGTGSPLPVGPAVGFFVLALGILRRRR